MTVAPGLLGVLAEALAPLPGPEGGAAVVLVAGPPSAALLSTGNVHLQGDRLRVAVQAGSSVLSEPATRFLLLVPARGTALRVVVAPSSARHAGAHAVLEGPVAAVRPSVELPWALSMGFVATGADGAADYVAFWRRLRAWLAAGGRGESPPSP